MIHVLTRCPIGYTSRAEEVGRHPGEQCRLDIEGREDLVTMTLSKRHDIFPWNGGFRYTRCGGRVADSGLTNGVDCTPITWESGTFQLLHVSAG